MTHENCVLPLDLLYLLAYSHRGTYRIWWFVCASSSYVTSCSPVTLDRDYRIWSVHVVSIGKVIPFSTYHRQALHIRFLSLRFYLLHSKICWWSPPIAIPPHSTSVHTIQVFTLYLMNAVMIWLLTYSWLAGDGPVKVDSTCSEASTTNMQNSIISIPTLIIVSNTNLFLPTLTSVTPQNHYGHMFRSKTL
jgi:hypothetical protein